VAQKSKQTRAKKGPPQPPSSRRPGKLEIAGIILAAIALAILALIFFDRRTVTAPPTSDPRTRNLIAHGQPIDHIRCESEMLGYHVHAHLTILNLGRNISVPQYIGFSDNTCLYWLHTHDDSGIIHVEAPSHFFPTLGNFFDVWGQPLSSERVVNAVVGPGHSMRVYVNGRPFSANPRTISLRDHTTIAIEIGPPFSAPQPYDFSGY
jgi:hypothetical protein